MKHGILKTGTPIALTILAALTWLFGKNIGLTATWTGVLVGAFFALGVVLYAKNEIRFATTSIAATQSELESYYSRVWRRFLKDATPWARDNIGWGIVVLLLPPALTFFRDRHAQIDWPNIRSTLILYAVALPLYFLVHLIQAPKKLDQERDAREAALRQEITARDETIKQQNAAPKYTAAEQHDYETARKALKTTGPKGLTALRHIRSHGRLTFGTFPPVLPPGLSNADTLWVFNHCASEGVLSCQGTHERTFSVTPKMEKILDDLLFSEDTTAK